jgi:hypothetical protein
MTNPPVPAAPLTEQRDRVVERLSSLYARDQLSLEEFESRLDRVYAARTPDALNDTLAGLPVETTAVVPEAEAAPGGRTYFAMMSGVVRRGVWLVPKRIRAIAFMGGVELDLREAKLSPGVTEIRAVAVMGGVVVTVPPNVRLESDGFAFMGGFEDQLKGPASSDPNAPVVRLTGFAMMGGVEGRVRARGEPNED